MEKARQAPLKTLAALVRILRDANVTRYQTPELTLEFSPAGVAEEAVKRALAAAGVEVGDVDDVTPEPPSDPRFMLERLAEANRPKPRAD